MSEDNKQPLGDGSDNYIGAAQKAAEAGKGFTQSAAQSAAEKGVEAGVNAATAAQASIEGGKAVAEIAAGSAAGGPVGAILSAAWAMRHTLFKVLICVTLALVFLITMVVSLPSIVFNNIFRTDPDSADLASTGDMHDILDELSGTVADCVTAGYDYAFSEVERIISDGGYDYDLSMEVLINHGLTSADYDTCYVLAAYSMSMEQRGTTKLDMVSKLNAVQSQMFPVTYEVKSTTVTVPAADPGEEDGTEVVYYVECTIHPFDQSVILKAFNIDIDAQYNLFGITCGEATAKMASALKITIYGTVTGGSVPPITDAELVDFLANLDCSPVRKSLIGTALSLVGKVPYFWGGKSAPGWNEEWNTPKLVTALGSRTTGTLRPYGLDCSGFTHWVYNTALSMDINHGTGGQWYSSTAITKNELLPGDLGFQRLGSAGSDNHVLIYAGTDAEGNLLWIHCAGSTGVVINSPTYVKYYMRPNNIDWGD